MSSDRYLHIVLTIIAACLVYLCAILTPVSRVAAAPGDQHVYIAGWIQNGEERAISASQLGGLPVHETR